MIFSKSTIRLFIVFAIAIVLCPQASAAANKLEILFTANINAIVKNCYCGEPSLGGLARIMTLVEKERQNNPDLILIDGGDAFNPYSYPKLNQAVGTLYTQLKPNIMVPGDQEWVEGEPFLRSFAQKFKTDFLLSNAVVSTFSTRPKLKITTATGANIYLLSYLDKQAFNLISMPKNLLIDEDLFLSVYNNISDADFLIVIYHGPSRFLSEFAGTYSNSDLILAAHTQSGQIDLAKRPAIVNAGCDGEYVQRIIIDFNTKGPAIEVNAIPVTLDIEPNPDALKLIKELNIR